MNINSMLNLCNINFNCENNFEVSDIVYDSRKAVENCVFICLEGSQVDGHDYVSAAVENGAKLIIAQKEVEAAVPVITVNDTKEALANFSAVYFDKPFEKLKTIGITGTKGKTTTSMMIKCILESAGHKVGVIGTIGFVIGSKVEKLNNTTPESYLVQKCMAKMVEEGCDFCVMEVSSIGLKEKRVFGFEFDCGVFLNFSEDHIGGVEHKDMEEYLNSKAMLFKMCKLGILNLDDASFEGILKGHTCKVQTFGFNENADFNCVRSELLSKPGLLGSEFEVNGNKSFVAELSIPGKFNVYNALAALSTCLNFNVSVDQIKKGLLISKVKGRVEPIEMEGDFTLLIDYAHNAVSMESVLSTLRQYNPKRLVCLFGAGGNRPKLRRYEMGEVCGNMADLSVITADNSRFEDVLDIIEDIKIGMSKTDGEFIEIPDRKEAIKFCIKNAKDGDIIVLAGKGHEDYQEIKGVKYPFDERVVIAQILQELKEG